MLAGENDTAVNLAEIVIMLCSCLFAPVAGATQREGHTMPRDGDAILVFGPILRMNGGAEFDSSGDPLGRRHRRELEGAGAVEKIPAQKHAPAGTIEAGVRPYQRARYAHCRQQLAVD